MATAKKKTNYVAANIKKFEAYISQIEAYLDSHPADMIKDRLDVRYSTNGNPIVKTIASEEAQLKSFSDHLMKLPSLIESLNKLRQMADTGDAEVVDKARGDRELPGLFKSRMLGNINQEKIEEAEEVEAEEVEAEEVEDDDVWEEDE